MKTTNNIPYAVVEVLQENKKYEEVRQITFPDEVWEAYAKALHAHYLEKANYVRRIVRKQRYTHLEVVVYYKHCVRTTFYLPEH